MAITNLTEDEKQTRQHDQLLCSAAFTEGIDSQLIGLAVLNIFQSITTILGNILFLAALHKETSLHPPSKLLLRSLAASDLCVGLVSEPLVVTFWISAVKERWNICRYALIASFIAGYILGPVSLLTVTAISVDRLLALSLGLRYRQVVTLKRTYGIVITIWIMATIASTFYFWNYTINLWYGYIVISFSLVTSIFCYTKIFLTLRQHQTQVQDQVHQEQSSQTGPLNIARYRKAVSSALWLQLTLVACYLPFGIVAALSTQKKESSSFIVARQFTLTLVYLNSSLNPILYCWKIKEVRQAVKDTIRQLFCSSS